MKAVVLEQQGSLEQLKYVPDFADPVVMQEVVIRVWFIDSEFYTIRVQRPVWQAVAGMHESRMLPTRCHSMTNLVGNIG